MLKKEYSRIEQFEAIKRTNSEILAIDSLFDKIQGKITCKTCHNSTEYYEKYGKCICSLCEGDFYGELGIKGDLGGSDMFDIIKYIIYSYYYGSLKAKELVTLDEKYHSMIPKSLSNYTILLLASSYIGDTEKYILMPDINWDIILNA